MEKISELDRFLALVAMGETVHCEDCPIREFCLEDQTFHPWADCIDVAFRYLVRERNQKK